MNYLNKIKLKTRMLLSILTATFLIFAITVIVIVFNARTTARDAADQIAETKSMEASARVKIYLEHAMDEARSLARNYEAMKLDGNVTRSNYYALSSLALQREPNFLSVWIMFESNVVDNNDKAYIGNSKSDELGHLSVTQYRDKGKFFFEETHQEDYSEEYYAKCFSSGNEIVMEPEYYSYVDDTTNQFFLTTIAVPVRFDGKVVGVVGIDIDLEELYKLNSTIKIYSTGHGMLVSNEGVIVSHPEKTNIGKSIDEIESNDNKELKEAIKKGESFETTRYSSYLQKDVMCYYNPIKVGGSKEYLSYCAVVPISESMEKANRMMMLAIIISIIGLIILSLIIFSIANSIIKPIRKSVAITKQVAEGDLTIDITIDREDELGELLQAMSSMAVKLREMILSLRANAEQVLGASSEINSSAQQLSEGASEQASSVEQVASSMEEMVANIQQNTDNAKQTEKISQQAREGIIFSNQSTSSSSQSMQGIASKIRIINDIAFQTNLLALNAAVEAARAGEHGKGFAVVASEVRRLAEHSKVAANEIESLIKEGVRVSESASKQLSDLVPNIEKTAKLVQEITASSIEQNTGASQINNAILELNKITQINAASSEELASTAEQLSAQAEQLNDLIGYFKVDDKIHHAVVAKKETKLSEKVVPKSNLNVLPHKRRIQETKGAIINLDKKYKDEEFERF